MEVKIPKELTKDVETINAAIEALKFIRQIKKGRTVKSTRGIGNKFKFYLLGYVLQEVS